MSLCCVVTHGWLNAVHKMGMVDDPITGICVAGAGIGGALLGWVVQGDFKIMFFVGLLIGAYGGVFFAVGLGLWDTPEARIQVRHAPFAECW